MALVSPANQPAQRRARAAELWRCVRKRRRGSARGQANKQPVENKGSREATLESHGVPWGGGSWSAMMTAREELETATSRCKISRRRRSLHAQRAELGDHQTTRK